MGRGVRRGTFACELRAPPGRGPRSYPRRGPPNTDGLGKGNIEDCGVSEEASNPASAVREASVQTVTAGQLGTPGVAATSAKALRCKSAPGESCREWGWGKVWLERLKSSR